MTLPLAEQIVKDAGCNQWFVQFFENGENFDTVFKTQHMNFFAEHKMIVQQVTSIADPQNLVGFYHVRFFGATDPLLALYSKQFEDAEGVSLHPQQYQMFEWSHSGWIKHNGPQQLQAYLDSLNQPTEAHGMVGNVGPAGP